MNIGVYSIKIGSINSSELELENNTFDIQYYEEPKDVDLEIRLVIFHILKIPVFPIKRIYCKKGDKTRESLAPEIIEQIKRKTAFKTPWYSFLFVIVAVIGLSIFFAENRYENFKYYQQRSYNYDLKVTNYKNTLQHLNNDYFIRLINTKKPYLAQNLYMKIDSIRSLLIYYSLFASSEDHLEDVISIYNTIRDTLQNRTIEKGQMQNMLVTDYKIYEEQLYERGIDHNLGMAIFNDERKFLVDEIFSRNEPKLEAKIFKKPSNEIELVIFNSSDPVHLEKVEINNNNIGKLKNDLPLTIEKRSELNFEFERSFDTEYNFDLYFRTSMDTLYTYTLVGKMHNPYLIRKW